MNEIWTIELNLDADYADACAYHIDALMTTIRQNISHAEEGKKSGWVLVGLAKSSKEANEKCKELRILLCKKNGKEHKNLPFAEIEEERFCQYHLERWNEKIKLKDGYCSECYMG